MTLFDRVVTVLDRHGIAYALIGAAALAARGIARSTYDLDLLVADARVLETDRWERLRADAVQVEIRRGDADDPLGGVVRCEWQHERPVDIILGKHQWQQRAVERADRFADGPPVVTSYDLVLLKLYAGGAQDLWDIRELLRLPDAPQIITRVAADVAELSEEMQQRWTDARA
jgi:hypothetical protein